MRNKDIKRQEQNRRSGQAGQILIESIVGISVALMGLLAVLALLTRSYAYTQTAGQRFIATYLAAEGIEVVRSIVDKNYVDGQPWDSGISAVPYMVDFNSQSLMSGSSEPLAFDAATGIYTTDQHGTGINITPFTRTITIAKPSANEMAVVSKVTWSAKGQNDEVVLEDHFFDWRP